MKLYQFSRALSLVAFSGLLITGACSSDDGGPSGDGDTEDTQTPTGDGDDSASGDGDDSASGDGDDSASGDGDDSASGDGDDSASGDGDGDDSASGDGDSGGGGAGGAPAELAELEQTFAGKVLAVDELRGVSISSDNLIYASGTKVVDLGSEAVPELDTHTAVARFTSNGELDTTFGTDGVVLLNIAPAAGDLQAVSGSSGPGGESSTTIVALPEGGCVVAVNANDGTGERGGKLVLARLDVDGELVEDFGVDGLAEIPLTDWVYTDDTWTATNHPASSAWDIQLDTSGDEDRVVVFGYAPAKKITTRVDNDRYIARLFAEDGTLDTTFADDGIFSIDFGENELSDSARRGIVLEDGAVVSSGYTVLGDARHHIFLLKLDPSGTPVSDFGFFENSACGTEQSGVICSNPFITAAGFAEAYGVTALSDGSLVTTGYGAPSDTSSGSPDVVSFRFYADSRDSSYAGVGGLIIDSSAEDRGRDVVALSDDRVVHVGKYAGTAATYLTSADGQLDDSFGDNGIRTYPLHDGNLFDVDTRGGLVATVGSTASTAGAYLIVYRID